MSVEIEGVQKFGGAKFGPRKFLIGPALLRLDEILHLLENEIRGDTRSLGSEINTMKLELEALSSGISGNLKDMKVDSSDLLHKTAELSLAIQSLNAGAEQSTSTEMAALRTAVEAIYPQPLDQSEVLGEISELSGSIDVFKKGIENEIASLKSLFAELISVSTVPLGEFKSEISAINAKLDEISTASHHIFQGQDLEKIPGDSDSSIDYTKIIDSLDLVLSRVSLGFTKMEEALTEAAYSVKFEPSKEEPRPQLSGQIVESLLDNQRQLNKAMELLFDKVSQIQTFSDQRDQEIYRMISQIGDVLAGDA